MFDELKEEIHQDAVAAEDAATTDDLTNAETSIEQELAECTAMDINAEEEEVDSLTEDAEIDEIEQAVEADAPALAESGDDYYNPDADEI